MLDIALHSPLKFASCYMYGLDMNIVATFSLDSKNALNSQRTFLFNFERYIYVLRPTSTLSNFTQVSQMQKPKPDLQILRFLWPLLFLPAGSKPLFLQVYGITYVKQWSNSAISSLLWMQGWKLLCMLGDKRGTKHKK